MTLRLFDEPGLDGGACFSPCRVYRYMLWRVWSGAPRAVFCMLNPSTADEQADDPTIRRCIGFAKAWGHGGVCVVNLFALRSTAPAGLLGVVDPVGPDNDDTLRIVARTTPLVFAWGSQAGRLGRLVERRARAVRELVEGLGGNPVALATTQTGAPRHPLYLAGDLQPRPWP